MSTVDQLIATARKNEVIARNLFDIEVAILNVNVVRFLRHALGLGSRK